LAELDTILKNANSIVAEIKRKALKTLAIEADISVQKNFDAHGRPPWTPRKRISKKQRKTNILVISGHMRLISATVDEAGGRVILRANPLARAYSAIQHFGGTINMPARNLKFRKVTAGRNKGRTVFAGGRHSRISKEVTSKPYTITIPPRPWMTVPASDYGRILSSIRMAVKI